MFSGIIEKVARICNIEKHGEYVRLSVDLEELGTDVKVGDSVSVNGVCLTVVKLSSSIACFEMISETIARTNLSRLRAEESVNVERSLKLTDRIGGHLILGHVDGVGVISERIESNGSSKVWVSASPDIIGLMIPKGSVALDGISLTLVDVERDKFSVCLIPHTLEVTTLNSKRIGDEVNIEVDMIGKYIRKFVSDIIQDPSTIRNVASGK